MDRLQPGVHELFEPIRVSGTDLCLRGSRQGNIVTTRLRRGRRPDGSIYTGPLISIEHCRNARICDLIVEGARFAVVDGLLTDARHPLATDRGSAHFPCGRSLPEPDCFEPSSFISDCEADLVVAFSSNVEVVGVEFRDPVRIGVAIARETSGITMRQCTIAGAGDYGIWAGTGVEPIDPCLPLPTNFIDIMPRGLRIEECLIERSGSAGVYLEARDAVLMRARLSANCCDAPYNDAGGQLTVDYKASGVHVVECSIIDGRHVVRRRVDGGDDLLGSFGAEVCGSDVVFEKTLIEGNSCEGVQILGGRNVVFRRNTQVINNHLASRRFPDYPGDPRRFGISVSTTAAFERLGANAETIEIDETSCENGLAVWSDGSVADWRLRKLKVRRSDLSGPDHSGVYVGVNDKGCSLRGDAWALDEPLL